MRFSSQPFCQALIFLFLTCGICISLTSTVVWGQESKSVIRGKIAFDPAHLKSWDDQELSVSFSEIPATLRQHITVAPPYPQGHDQWDRETRLKWESQFVTTDEGKKFLADRKKRFEEALVFDIKFESDGSFVVFDVPAGTYGIQGGLDRTIGGSQYGFEVYGKLKVVKGVDEIALQPLMVEITPLLDAGQTAPPLSIKTHDNGADLKLERFGKDPVFVNFWSTTSPTSADEQKNIQDVSVRLQNEFSLKLFSINVDPDREKSLKFVVDNRLKQGSHGFTGGFGHSTLFDYGVRSFPSYWLIQDGKILMTQFDFAQAMRQNPELDSIIKDRLTGTDASSKLDK